MAGLRSLLFAELTRTELAALAPLALAVVPLGATEQHGPHLPTGTDSLHAEWVARDAAQQASAEIQLVVTPTLPFGSSEHHFPFGATISLPVSIVQGEKSRDSGGQHPGSDPEFPPVIDPPLGGAGLFRKSHPLERS